MISRCAVVGLHRLGFISNFYDLEAMVRHRHQWSFLRSIFRLLLSAYPFLCNPIPSMGNSAQTQADVFDLPVSKFWPPVPAVLSSSGPSAAVISK